QQIGLILGAFGAAMAISHIPAGYLADRFGRRPLLFIAWGLGITSALVMGFARELPLFVVGMIMYGLTIFVSSPLSSYVTSARGNWSVARALTLITATFSYGMVLGPIIGGWLGELFGLRFVYFVAAGIFMISMIFILFIERQPVDNHDPDNPPPSIFKNRAFVGYLGVVAFGYFAMFLAQPLTPNFLEGVRGLTLQQTGIIFSLGALGNAWISVQLGKANPKRGLLTAHFLVVCFVVLIWRGSSMPYYMLGYFLLGGYRAFKPLTMAEARMFVHDSQMGLTYGTMETLGAIIFIIAPPIAGFLYEPDPAFVYPFSLGLILVSVILTYFFTPKDSPHA
ncbi:MAG TPA: MFS transporter, partial [Anaerolineales bacterium]|nr:MFS transporter [Anaerolineales bacterium]